MGNIGSVVTWKLNKKKSKAFLRPIKGMRLKNQLVRIMSKEFIIIQAIQQSPVSVCTTYLWRTRSNNVVAEFRLILYR